MIFKAVFLVYVAFLFAKFTRSSFMEWFLISKAGVALV